MPIVGVYHEAPDDFIDLIRDTASDDCLRLSTTWNGLPKILPELDVLLAFRFRGRPFPREAILAAPRLRWLQLSSAGIDHMLPFAPATPLTVTNTSGLHADSVALYVFAGLMHLLWDFPRFQEQQRERSWERRQLPLLRGRTIGIVGAGRIGSRIASVARTLGMTPIGLRRSGGPKNEFERMYAPGGLGELMEQSDVVVACLPLTPQTRGMLGSAALSRLRPTAYVLNVSRGGVVDESALLRVLREGLIAGAVLDVFEREPLPRSSEFWELPNVLITPHLAGEFELWPRAVAELFCANLRRWIAGDELDSVVNLDAGY